MLFMKTSPEISSKILSNQKQFINTNLMKQNLKNPLEKQELLKKYSPQTQMLNKCLPAKFWHNPIYGKLLIKFESIVLSSTVQISKAKHVVYRCRMLGYSQSECPYLSNNITFTIHTNNKMFKHYLKDMRICLVQVLDDRNYEPIGHFYINWLTYMRSVQDNQPLSQKYQNTSKYEQNTKTSKKYFLPFLDEQCSLTLPVFDYRNSKIVTKLSEEHNFTQQVQKLTKPNPKERIIGQIQIKFMSRIYEYPIAKGFISIDTPNIKDEISLNGQNEEVTHENENQNKINLSPSYLQIPQSNKMTSNKNMISSKSLSPSNQAVQNHLKYQYNSQINQNYQMPQLKRQQSNHSTFNHERNSNRGVAYHNIYKIDGSGTGSRLYNHEDQQKSYHRNINDKQIHKIEDKFNKLKAGELQLLQLKLDVQQFFKTDLDNQLNKKQQKTVIEIIKLKSKIQNITQLDIFLNQNQDELNSDSKQNSFKPHIKIYKISSDKLKNQDFFKSKVIIDRPFQRIIQIHLPNNQGKCIFRCKDLSGTNNDICVYNKGIIVGVLSIKKQIEKKEIISNINNNAFLKSGNTKSSQFLKKQETDKICIVLIQNFTQQFNKNSQLNQVSYLDNYSISLKSIQFYHQTLHNSKTTGEYAITNSLSIPKLFAVEVKNSQNQFVGMSQNICFQGNQIQLINQNIMPTLILEKKFNIQLKKMPLFKKLPNSISFRLSIFIANTNQLNYFINKWKQNINKNKLLQVKRQKSLSNAKALTTKQIQKLRQKQYTLSDQIVSQMKNNDKRMKTQSQNKNQRSINYKNLQSKSSGVRQSDKQRFKTQGNYTQDLNNQALVNNDGSQIKQKEEHYSLKQGQLQDEIYLVEFFCKSLHFVLSKLESKKLIQQKLTELTNYQYTKNNSKNQQSRQIQQEKSISEPNKGLVSKDQFQRILSILIGDNKQQFIQILGFDVTEILQALFIVEDVQMIKMQEFTLCLMAYYNFMLLLTNEKLNALKQVLSCQPQAEQKLLKIKESMTNINSQFLWEDILPNVIQKTKQKINKRYRIYPNTPFSVNQILQDIFQVKKQIQDINNQNLFINLLNVLNVEQEKKYDIFIRTTADLGNLVRQTVEQIIFAQCIKNSNVILQNSWLQNAILKMREFIQRQNMESISSDGKNQFCFNLTQFQQFFSSIGIETSIWQSLMLIEEIKVWHQSDQIKQKQGLQTGEGIIAVQLVKAWFNTLNTKIQMKNRQKILRKQINTKSSRLNSVKSIDSDEEDIIEQINKKQIQKDKQIMISEHQQDRIKQMPKSPINKISNQKHQLISNKYQFQKHNIFEDRQPASRKNSLKQSQTMNNESDIANIANLLRQNENNLYFLPSMTDPNTLNKITSGNILSNQNILRGLQQNTMRNNPVQSLQTKKSNIISINRHEFDKIDSDSSQLKQNYQSKVQQIKNKTKIQSVFSYLSIQVKQIKLKRKQIVVQTQGLKKLLISFQKNLNRDQSRIDNLQQNSSNSKKHYFLTKQTVRKIFDNTQSQLILQNYTLNNFKVDVNNLYQFQTLYNQGVSIQLINLTQQKTNKKDISTDNKQQKVIFSGTLPIQDVIQIIQEYKNKNCHTQQLSQTYKHSKKKTIVLYNGREIIGKAVVEFNISNNQIVQQKQKNHKSKVPLTQLEFKFVKKQLFNTNKRNNKAKEQISNPVLMSLFYCSVRNYQQSIQILSIIDENTIHTINLPQPILQYQLILKSLQIGKHKVEQNILQGSNLSQISRFTRFDKQKTKNQPSNQCKQQCIIPLQTLYFRKNMKQEYPLIDQQSGRFIATIQINLKIIDSKQIDIVDHQQISQMIQ